MGRGGVSEHTFGWRDEANRRWVLDGDSGEMFRSCVMGRTADVHLSALPQGHRTPARAALRYADDVQGDLSELQSVVPNRG
jgi:hypothetical protein